MMDSFITKDGKKLRRGYTTGTCAAAAAKTAAIMLLEHRRLESVFITTPGGISLDLKICDMMVGEDYVSCAVVKDSGDDPDMTNGIKIFARVEKAGREAGITIDGGEGVGRVTKPGLDQAVGNAAINSAPRRMIEEELRQVCEDNGYGGGLRVVISAPEGVEIAKRTFNPRLGIVGGISILGTTGIVEPMSDDAVVQTIRAELSMRSASGKKTVLLTPGNYGARFIREELGLDQEIAVTTSNFIGDAFSIAAEKGFSGTLLVGHVGKLIKLAGGMFNTHSRYGDCRAEIMACHAGLCGAPVSVIRRITESVMTDDMLAILDAAGLREQVMESVMRKIERNIEDRRFGQTRTGVIVFSKEYGVLGMTSEAEKLLDLIRKEY
jgi:cobalt-precorrin-5B (C1)-methyltransferase